MRREAKAFRGLWIEPLDGREYRWRCGSCDWSQDSGHGDGADGPELIEVLDSFLTHTHTWEFVDEDGE